LWVLLTAAVLPAVPAGDTMLVRRVVNDTPNIDGLIEVQEWISSIEYDISDINARCGVVRPPGSVLVRFLYDSAYLYAAVDVPPVQTRGNYDQAGLYVDENHDHLWAGDSSEGNYWIEYVSADSLVYRALLSTAPSVWRMPGQCPGCFSASGTLSGHMQLEARIPIGPGRSDLTIEPGDTVGFFEYVAQSPGNVYWGWFPQSLLMAHWADPTYYGHIVLDTCVVGIQSPAPRTGPGPVRLCATVARGVVRLAYAVPSRADVTLGVYDAAGSLVRTLQSGVRERGQQTVTWDRTSNSGRRVASGTCFFRLTVDGRSVSSKAVVLE
jgi:hypothetical protein